MVKDEMVLVRGDDFSFGVEKVFDVNYLKFRRLKNCFKGKSLPQSLHKIIHPYPRYAIRIHFSQFFVLLLQRKSQKNIF